MKRLPIDVIIAITVFAIGGFWLFFGPVGSEFKKSQQSIINQANQKQTLNCEVINNSSSKYPGHYTVNIKATNTGTMPIQIAKVICVLKDADKKDIDFEDGFVVNPAYDNPLLPGEETYFEFIFTSSVSDDKIEYVSFKTALIK